MTKQQCIDASKAECEKAGMIFKDAFYVVTDNGGVICIPVCEEKRIGVDKDAENLLHL